MALSNRLTRILVAIFAIPFLLISSYLGSYYFLTFVMIVALFSFSEFSKMLQNNGVFVSKHFGLAIVLFLVLNTYFDYVETETYLLVSLLLLLIFELFRNNGSAIQNFSGTIMGILYPGLFASMLLKIRALYPDEINYENGGLIIISVLITLWVIDSAAYFIGTAFGKHKLFPRVSPKKSWEGAIAGFVFGMITIVVSREFFATFLSLQDAIILGIIIGIFGQIGDLVESLIKRDAGVKDSSSIIPGHGGIFDRFDSLIFTSPFVYLYLKYFVL